MYCKHRTFVYVPTNAEEKALAYQPPLYIRCYMQRNVTYRSGSIHSQRLNMRVLKKSWVTPILMTLEGFIFKVWKFLKIWRIFRLCKWMSLFCSTNDNGQLGGEANAIVLLRKPSVPPSGSKFWWSLCNQKFGYYIDDLPFFFWGLACFRRPPCEAATEDAGGGGKGLGAEAEAEAVGWGCWVVWGCSSWTWCSTMGSMVVYL